MVIRGNYLYTVGGGPRNDVVYCLNAETGKKIWTYTYECNNKPYGPQATPAIDGDNLYTLSTTGRLTCLNAKKGKVLWFRNITEDFKVTRPGVMFSGSPVVAGDLLIITCNTYGFALKKSTGEMAWSSPVSSVVVESGGNAATPVAYMQRNELHALMFSDFGVYSIEMKKGNPDWFYRWPPEKSGLWYNIADPIIFDNKVFVSTGYQVGCALLDIGSGTPKVLWRNKNMSNHFSTCVLIDGYLYGCHGQAGFEAGTLRCLEVVSGKMMWEKDLGRPMCLSAAGSKLLIITDRGRLHISEGSPKSYIEISSAQVFEKTGPIKAKCWTPPVLCGGKIYCHELFGDLVCIDMRK